MNLLCAGLLDSIREWQGPSMDMRNRSLYGGMKGKAHRQGVEQVE